LAISFNSDDEVDGGASASDDDIIRMMPGVEWEMPSIVHESQGQYLHRLVPRENRVATGNYYLTL